MKDLLFATKRVYDFITSLIFQKIESAGVCDVIGAINYAMIK